jgi:hypothetical protein
LRGTGVGSDLEKKNPRAIQEMKIVIQWETEWNSIAILTKYLQNSIVQLRKIRDNEHCFGARNHFPQLCRQVSGSIIFLRSLIRKYHQFHIVKVKKVKLSLCLIKHHVMKTYWGVEVYLHAFLNSALHGGELPASRTGRFTPRIRAPPPHGTQRREGCVGPRADLDAATTRKKITSLPLPRIEPRSSLWPSLYNEWATAATQYYSKFVLVGKIYWHGYRR